MAACTVRVAGSLPKVASAQASLASMFACSTGTEEEEKIEDDGEGDNEEKKYDDGEEDEDDEDSDDNEDDDKGGR